jgi:hypothetical protein
LIAISPAAPAPAPPPDARGGIEFFPPAGLAGDGGDVKGSPAMARSAREYLALARKLLLEREELPPPPEPGPSAPPRPPGPGVARLLFGREELPLDPVAPERERPGLLRMLLGPEPLPRDPPAPPQPRAHWLRWLFAPERIDRS